MCHPVLEIGNHALTSLESPRPPLSHVEPAERSVFVALVRDRLDLLRRAAASVPAPLFRNLHVREGRGPVARFGYFKMQFKFFYGLRKSRKLSTQNIRIRVTRLLVALAES